MIKVLHNPGADRHGRDVPSRTIAKTDFVNVGSTIMPREAKASEFALTVYDDAGINSYGLTFDRENAERIVRLLTAALERTRAVEGAQNARDTNSPFMLDV